MSIVVDIDVMMAKRKMSVGMLWSIATVAGPVETTESAAVVRIMKAGAMTTASGLIAIVRGIAPADVVQVGRVLGEEGFDAVEVPLNSPAPSCNSACSFLSSFP